METVAFYSYKGGVGRSLLLANAARFLATLGKGVVALDFDFEAPGLHYKLGGVPTYDRHSVGGAVPYLIATAEGATSPPPLEKHMMSVPVPTDAEGWLRLMPAGPAPHQTYWAAFKDLGDRLHFGDPSGQGFMALLDLQARIADELKPDYLLIDARTGVTELGGLATTILADTVVCMFVANQESLDGTLTVVEALKAAPRLANQKPIRVVPVVSRETTKRPEDERFASGVNRLAELTEGKKGHSKDNPPNYVRMPRALSDPNEKKGQSKNIPVLFALPHDSVFGASERVLGVERKASAFSPLYKAYLELFQKLFPSSTETAKHVLERLEAVANIREDLTSNRRDRHGSDDLFPPWTDSAIQEGVLYKADRYNTKETRYADLVCRDEAGPPLMVVEYIPDGDEGGALEFWSKSTKVRCAVLLKKQSGYVQRLVFTRGPDQDDLHGVRRWDLPRPREFDLLVDVGDRSVESMLDALRHGHIEAVAWLVNEWQDSSSVAMMPHKEATWRPERARRILDGLASTEDLRCAEEILRRATPGGYDLRHRERRFRDDFDFDDGLDQRMAEELFAPLFWRLPVEGVLESMEPKRYPGQMPSLAGQRLLAEELMGLRYNPDRSAMEEARGRAARLPPAERDRDDDGDGEWPLRWMYRRRDLIEGVRFTDEAPPALVWEEVLREERWWRGTLQEAREKVGEKLKKLMGSALSLRSRLKGAASRGDLVTQGLLGGFDVSGRIELCTPVIAAAAEALGLSARYLKSVAFIQLSVWALAYQARDLDQQLGYGFAPLAQTNPFNRESPAHVAIVQAFTDRLIRKLEDPNLQAAFEKLSKHQTEPYARWASMRKLPLEKLRTLLLTARASAPALGLPDVGDAE